MTPCKESLEKEEGHNACYLPKKASSTLVMSSAVILFAHEQADRRHKPRLSVSIDSARRLSRFDSQHVLNLSLGSFAALLAWRANHRHHRRCLAHSRRCVGNHM